MLFNSTEFIFYFLPVTLVIYFVLNKFRLLDMAKVWLIGASLFFYANPKMCPPPPHFNAFLFLLISSVAINFSLGTAICNTFYKSKITKRALLVSGIILNLCSIGYYKYYNFFIDNINSFFHTDYSFINVILPLGISFFTFQQIAYLIDSYHGKTKEYDFLNYMLFVVFFPQLIAGPIVRHEQIIHQFRNIRNKFFNWKNFSEGFYLFLTGLFKKIAIADTLAVWANLGYANSAELSFFQGWITALGYTFQIYYDFSGYTDMALGLGKMFNIKLPENFNNPYSSTSISEFWRRWHMTLSSFLKDYLYFPLGGSRNKHQWRTYLNLMIVFSVCGLWHGASWMFVIWGLLHGSAVCINKLWKNTKIVLPAFVCWLLTFTFVNITWVFFRAPDMEKAADVLKAMFGLNGFYLPQFSNLTVFFQNPKCTMPDIDLLFIILLGILISVIYIGKAKPNLKILKPNFAYAITAAFMLFYSLMKITDTSYISPFLYFNF